MVISVKLFNETPLLWFCEICQALPQKNWNGPRAFSFCLLWASITLWWLCISQTPLSPSPCLIHKQTNKNLHFPTHPHQWPHPLPHPKHLTTNYLLEYTLFLPANHHFNPLLIIVLMVNQFSGSYLLSDTIICHDHTL